MKVETLQSCTIFLSSGTWLIRQMTTAQRGRDRITKQCPDFHALYTFVLSSKKHRVIKERAPYIYSEEKKILRHHTKIQIALYTRFQWNKHDVDATNMNEHDVSRIRIVSIFSGFLYKLSIYPINVMKNNKK